MLDEALRYADFGMCIIPVKLGTKQPACRSWKEYQTKQPDSAKLRRWFQQLRNLAVVMGDVSGGLVCRDFDAMPAYERWAAQNATLARTLPTVETGRPGRHVYCRCDVGAVKAASGTGASIIDFGDGELRAGGYCLLPPSQHPSGHIYRWLNPLGESLPCLDLAETGFIASHATESNREDRGQQRNTEASSGGESVSVVSAVSVAELETAIETAIIGSLPTAPGRRNKLVFELARALKALPALSDAKANDLEPYVRRWHTLALPVIRTEPFEETWIDFLRAWPRVKYPKGSEPMAAIFERALSAELPSAADRYKLDGIRLLVSLCCELQRAAGEGPFYLSCRTAGRLLNVEHTTAWRWLYLLENDKVLSVVSRGSQKTGKATRFLYVGGRV